MSAYIVDKDHIVYLVQSAQAHGAGYGLGWDTASGEWRRLHGMESDKELAELGNMLYAENVKSVRARYPGEKDSELPGPVLDDGEEHAVTAADFRGLPGPVDPVQLLKSCACFRYQSCEHAGWEKSEASNFIDALERAAIHHLPGWDEAAWGAPERKETTALRLI